MLAPLLFNMVFTAVVRVADKRFLSDAAITENMEQLQREGRRNGKRRADHAQSKSRGGEIRSKRRCRGCGVRCRLTM